LFLLKPMRWLRIRGRAGGAAVSLAKTATQAQTQLAAMPVPFLPPYDEARIRVS